MDENVHFDLYFQCDAKILQNVTIRHLLLVGVQNANFEQIFNSAKKKFGVDKMLSFTDQERLNMPILSHLFSIRLKNYSGQKRQPFKTKFSM